MSSAFVRESDEQWLSDVSPSINALINFLTRENNGIRVYETKHILTADGRDIYVMSNGLGYSKGADGRWQVVEQLE